MILIMDGPDRCGKSEIAYALAKKWNIPYFKHSNEHVQFTGDETAFQNSLIYGATMLVDFLKQTRASVIIDRFTPSEFVYSQMFNRPTDWNVLTDIDLQLARMGVLQVICRRKDYIQPDDKYPEKLSIAKLRQIDELYESFLSFTKVKTYTLFVDDESLTRELTEIQQFVHESRKLP